MANVHLSTEVEKLKWFSTKYVDHTVFNEGNFDYIFKIDNKSDIFHKMTYSEIRTWLKDCCQDDVIIYCGVWVDYIIFGSAKDCMAFKLVWQKWTEGLDGI